MVNLPLQFVVGQLSNWESSILHALATRFKTLVLGDNQKVLNLLAQQEAEKGGEIYQDLAYRPFARPWLRAFNAHETATWAAAGVDMNAEILQFYGNFCRQFFEISQERQKESTAVENDCKLLPRLSYRIHYGAIYVAEYKFLAASGMWRELVKENDETAMMQALTRKDVEQRIEHRVTMLGKRLGGELLEEASRNLYKELVIPLTKAGEVRYLLRRATRYL